MIILETSINSLLQHIGIGITGSIVLFALLLIGFFALLMFVTNMPTQFILIVTSILIIGMNAIWGGLVLNILSIIIALIYGVIVGLFIIKLFSSSGA